MQMQIPFEDYNQKGKGEGKCRSLRDDNQKGKDRGNAITGWVLAGGVLGC